MLTMLQERLMRHLAAMGSIYETGPNEYVATPFSKSLKEPIYQDNYNTMFVSFKTLAGFIVQELKITSGWTSLVPASLLFRTSS